MWTSVRSPTRSRSIGARGARSALRHSSITTSNAFSAPRFWRMSSSTPRVSSWSSRIESWTSKIAASSRTGARLDARAHLTQALACARSSASWKRSISRGNRFVGDDAVPDVRAPPSAGGALGRRRCRARRGCPGAVDPLPLSRTCCAMSAAMRVDGLLRVGAVGAQDDRRAALGGEHHDAHDALAVHLQCRPATIVISLGTSRRSSRSPPRAEHASPFLLTICTVRSTISEPPRRGRRAARARATSFHPSTRPWRRTSRTATSATAIERAAEQQCDPDRRRAPARAGSRCRRRPRRRARCAAAHCAARDCRARRRRRARASIRRRSPQMRSAEVTRVVQHEEDQHDGERPGAEAEGDERDERARTAASRPTRADRRRCRADRRAPCGTARCAPAATPSSSARASAPTATDARYGCALKYPLSRASAALNARRVHPAGQQPQRRLEAEADAVAEQRLVVPRALDGERAHEHR